MKKEASERIEGQISVHPKGFGFVKVTDGPDIFIPKHLTLDAVDGDVVEVAVNPKVSPRGPEGEIVSIVKRGRTHLAGTILAKSRGHWTAYSPILGQEKWIHLKAKGASLEEGDRIVCKVSNWEKEGNFVEAQFVRKIGHISDPSVDIEAAIEEFGLPQHFTKEVNGAAKKFGKTVQPSELKERIDCTDWECVTIDPDTAKDFDDAISLTTDKRGHFFLGVHIADVAHYVKAGSVIDKEAANRCNSTYFPGQCIPMLPENLSNELCSLKPNVVRLTQAVLAEFTPQGDLVSFHVVRNAIKS
ncbi:MAG: RNB domain-containing ribonuclease [Chlamydiia bacterium]|nr:RNB domain-containing ribonuclease [Chlamydiia bacterium]